MRFQVDDLARFFKKLIGDISLQRHSDGFAAILSEFSERFGVTKYIFAYSYYDSLISPHHYVVTNANSWMEYYDRENLRGRDPIVKYIVERNTPVKWGDLVRMPSYGSEEQVEVMRCAAEHGLAHGVSIPCRTAESIGVLSFASAREAEIKNYDDLMLYGSILSNHLIENTRVIHDGEKNAPKAGVEDLTAREIDCLYWASEGKTAWEIGQILSITERTVVFHLTNATSKLGASSRQHAISKAFLYGILVPKF